MTAVSAGVLHEPILDAFLRRPGVAKLREDRPPRALIQKLLDAAVLVPNHHLSQPWRFIVLAGAERERFGQFLADRLKRNLDDPATPQAQAMMEAERRKPLRAPVVIVAASVRTDHPKAMPVEDLCATAGAVQTLLLAAPALGLAGFWRTGEPAYADDVKAYFGLKPDDDIVGFVYVGYPESLREPNVRAPAAEKSTWLGWEG